MAKFERMGSMGWIEDYEKEIRRPHLRPHTINPPAGWTNDSECYYLIMDLPDFKKDQVKMIVDQANLIIKGSRESGNEHVKFERHFKLPEDSDMTKPVSMKLQNDMLYITVYKQLVKDTEFEFKGSSNKETGREEKDTNAEGEKETKPESKEGDVVEKKASDEEKKEEINVPKSIIKRLDEHKCIWFGILAFVFGVYVASHKLHQPPRN